MKKWLGAVALLALFASSAFAGQASAPKVKGLYFGTWTPQGFVAESDTTFINGAVAGVDTTGPFTVSDMDMFPTFGGADPNASSIAFKVYTIATGGAISTDSCSVVCQFSYDGNFWSDNISAVTQGLLGNTSNAIFAFPFSFNRAAGQFTPAQAALPWAPLLRFIVKGDGNTAARQSGVKVQVSYYEATGNTPRLTVKTVPWGSYASSSNFVFVKDTTSFVSTTAIDTSGPIALGDLALPSFGNVAPQSGTAGDSTIAIVNISVIGSADAAVDSVYIVTEPSPDNKNWVSLSRTSSSSATVDGRTCLVQAGTYATNLAGTVGADALHCGLGSIPVTLTQSRYWVGGFFGTPYVRFRVSGGAVAMPGAKMFLTYLRAPSKQ